MSYNSWFLLISLILRVKLILRKNTDKVQCIPLMRPKIEKYLFNNFDITFINNNNTLLIN